MVNNISKHAEAATDSNSTSKWLDDPVLDLFKAHSNFKAVMEFQNAERGRKINEHCRIFWTNIV